MTWTSRGQFGTVQSKTSGSNVSLGNSIAFNIGDVAVVVVAKDNTSTTDGNTNESTSVTDNSSNTWIKAREYCNSQGGAASGATVAVWYSHITNALPVNGGIFVWFSATITAKAIVGWLFNESTGGAIALDGTPVDRKDTGADPGPMTLVTPSGEHLYFRGIAAETPTTSDIIPTFISPILFTSIGGIQTSGGGSASNMAVRGEFLITDPAGMTHWVHTGVMPSSQTWYGGQYGNGKFVALGLGSTAGAYSTDGATWSSMTLPVSTSWVDAGWNGANWCAISQSTTICATSTDGITWSQQVLPSSATWGYVTINPSTGMFLVTQQANSNVYLTSTTGATGSWTSRTLPNSNGVGPGPVWTGSRYLYVDAGSQVAVKAYTSTDGITWSGPFTVGNATNFGSGVLVSGGGVSIFFDHQTATYWTSDAVGQVWTQHTMTVGNNLTSTKACAFWNGSKFVVAFTGIADILLSANGTTWTLGASDGYVNVSTIYWKRAGGTNGTGLVMLLTNNDPTNASGASNVLPPSDPTYTACDNASVFFALKLAVANATFNGTTIADTASLIAGSLAATSNTFAGTILTDTASLIVGRLRGPNDSFPGQVILAPTAIIAGSLIAGPTLVAGGPTTFRLHLSGGVPNTSPAASLGGVPSQEFLGVVSGQTANFHAAPTVTGVTLVDCDGNAIGSGTLSYFSSTGILRWQPFNSGYNQVTLGSDGYYTIGTLDSYLTVLVTTGLLPASNASDTVDIIAHSQDLFDDVTYSQWSSGITEYRGVYLKNMTGATITSLTLSVGSQPGLGNIYIGFEQSDATFGVLGRDQVEISQLISSSRFQYWVEGASSARTDLSDFYNPFSATPFFYGAPLVAVAEDLFSDGTSTGLLSAIADEADSGNQLILLNWLTTKTVTNMANGQYLPFWVKRVIPPSTPGGSDVPNQFSLSVSYY